MENFIIYSVFNVHAPFLYFRKTSETLSFYDIGHIKQTNRNSNQELFCKKAVLRNSGKLARKYFLIESFLVKSQVVGPLFYLNVAPLQEFSWVPSEILHNQFLYTCGRGPVLVNLQVQSCNFIQKKMFIKDNFRLILRNVSETLLQKTPVSGYL